MVPGGKVHVNIWKCLYSLVYSSWAVFSGLSLEVFYKFSCAVFVDGWRWVPEKNSVFCGVPEKKKMFMKFICLAWSILAAFSVLWIFIYVVPQFEVCEAGPLRYRAVDKYAGSLVLTFGLQLFII